MLTLMKSLLLGVFCLSVVTLCLFNLELHRKVLPRNQISFDTYQSQSIAEYLLRRFQNLEYGEPPAPVSDEDKLRRELWLKTEEQFQNKTKSCHLPKIVGIGTEKCGTFALFDFLRPHPMIRMGRELPPELKDDPFVGDLEIEAHYFDQSSTSYDLKQYCARLPLAEEGAFVAEKTPAYFSFPPLFVPMSIKKVLPHTKLLLVLCDPVKRALSDFQHEWDLLRVHNESGELTRYHNFTSYLDVYLPRMTQEVGEWIEERATLMSYRVIKEHNKHFLNHILTVGLYALHLKRWFPYYDQSNLMIIDGGKLLSDPGPIIEEIQDFYDLPKLLLKEDYVRDPDTNYFCFKDWKTGELRRLPKSKQRTRNGNAKLTDEETVRLKSFYKTHNEALFKMLNRTFNWV
ncbi:unnamed protein product [Clavelina lepadiformis]|uniref:Sulfotransferase n=1 Tax=Clavelina lepadiformis TaxID=159417 RepID=A0ABP0FY42_CLALP